MPLPHSRSKAAIVLQYLMDGHELPLLQRIGMETYRLVNNRLCVKRYKIRAADEQHELVWLPVGFGDFSIQHFIEWAEQIEDTVIDGILANTALNAIKRSEAKPRGSTLEVKSSRPSEGMSP